MNKIVMKARAKINLSLDVVGKRDDGYHEMKMVNYSVDFFDILEISVRDRGIFLSSDASDIPLNHENLIVAAAEKILNDYQVDQGVDIYLKKQIPQGAGLAGGSSNAATTLIALNQLFKLNLSKKELAQIGVKLGADVPYCLYGKTALVEGIGERITPLPSFGKWALILIKPDIFINTGWAFKQLNLSDDTNHPNVEALIESFKHGKIDFTYAGNAFEKSIFQIYPRLKEIKGQLIDCGAEAAMMTGSGSTLVGYYSNHAQALRAYKQLKQTYEKCYFTTPV